MKNLKKIIFFVVLFSFIFSITVTKIEPTNITIGDDLIFNLTVEDYDSSISHDFYFNDFRNVETELNCTPTNSTILNCKIEEILYTDFVNELEKILYINGIKTNLKVNFKIPRNLKLLDFDNNTICNIFEKCLIFFKVNYIIYNIRFEIYFQDVYMNHCFRSNTTLQYIECDYIFPESYYGKTLPLKFDRLFN